MNSKKDNVNIKILLTDSIHLIKTAEGNYYTPSIYSREFLYRYTKVYDELWIAAKTKKIKNGFDPSKYISIDTDLVKIIELPWYKGFLGMIFKLIPIMIIFLRLRKKFDGYIFRIAQMESYLAFLFLNKKKKPYLAEVVNDPKTIFNSGFINFINILLFKRILSDASGISYVTEFYLQNLYSPKINKRIYNHNLFETYYSSVEIKKEDITEPRKFKQDPDIIKIIHIANTMSGNLKGQISIIKLVKKLVKNNYSVECVFIGEGDSIVEYQELVSDLNIQDNITFLGRIIDKSEIFSYIDKSNIFIYPTHMEGLPRVLIEAMARGIPIISSPVAGVPELLSVDFLHDPDDVDSMYKHVVRIFQNYEILTMMSEMNIKKVYSYASDKLNIRRLEFYEHLKKIIISA